MMDLYLLAVVRMKELRREAELAGRGRGRPAREGGRSVSRPRMVLARWLIAAAEWLWPEAGRPAMGGAR
jgi:hypothetical protein